MKPMKPNAIRMQSALEFVIANPGATMRTVIHHVLETTFDADRRERACTDDARSSKLYKQAASVVDRIIKDRHVRQDASLALFPWDAKRKAFAEAVERARHAALDPVDRAVLTEMTCNAWRAAGDENRARTIARLEQNNAYGLAKVG